MKPSEQIEKVYQKYQEEIMFTKTDWEANYLEIKQIHAAIAKIAEVLDEIYVAKRTN